ncbi:tripartite tricarboxylate transporter substrate binding protein [Variovorax sp.]|uniref:tripartite tricarboxylate transporter substrate binding protein n=1 Tax=Variovorax sp. TaxID=1871043 RepID=UPI002D3CBB37|nr:tripartite tricarboxylate transporter substrate binding protein [Variovorax sp.]HYP85422.1 tripartite tricarboxylate transporter substrate binding protein [Variovorax sp.]
MNRDRRRWLAGGAAALALGGVTLGPPVGAWTGEPFPSRPVTMWVPWAAGGATDLSLRLLAELAAPALGQPVIVANRPGAGGTLAMPVLTQAEPNGYTIAQMPQPVFRAPFVTKVLWDPVRDVTPIIQVSGVTFGVLVRAASPLRAMDQLFAFARSRPGELTIATNGIGTTPHLVLETLFTERGLRYIHVPYKGTSELTLAVESGQVMVGVNSTGFGPEVDAGRLRLLATLGQERSRRWSQVPTLRELGYGIVAMSPYGLSGPRGLPDEVVKVLHDAFRQAMFDPRFIEDLARYDQEVTYLGPHDYARACREEYERERAAAERMKNTRSTGS